MNRTAEDMQAFFLGRYMDGARKDFDQVKIYYESVIKYAEEIEALESGHYLYSFLCLGKIQWSAGDKPSAKDNFKKIKKHTKRSHGVHMGMRKMVKK